MGWTLSRRILVFLVKGQRKLEFEDLSLSLFLWLFCYWGSFCGFLFSLVKSVGYVDLGRARETVSLLVAVVSFQQIKSKSG